MSIGIFVTATDTGAGKSFVTAGLVRALLDAGYDACALKPVACGREPGEINADVALLLEAQRMPATKKDDINLYDFTAWAAPRFSAAPGEPAVDIRHLADWCNNHIRQHDLTLIEGIGGLMAPLNAEATVADWLRLMPDADVLLLVHARLGGINHALLTLSALGQMRRLPRWVVVNAGEDASDAMPDQHVQAITSFLGREDNIHALSRSPGARHVAAHDLPGLLADLIAELPHSGC